MQGLIIKRCAWFAGLILCSSALLSSAELQQSIDPDYLLPGISRTFSIEYVGKIPEIPTGTKLLRLWTGRDLALEPKQAGEPVNYLLNPYAEADGKSIKTEKSWSFRDLD